MTQIRDLMTSPKELDHELKLAQMTPEVAAMAQRFWAMNAEQDDG
jgi:hypothetical protein